MRIYIYLLRHVVAGAGLCVLSVLPCIPLFGMAQAAAMAAADQVGGYSEQVLDKVSRVWNPPVDSVERKVRIKISIDGDGKTLRCEPVVSSALAAMDKSACTAAREAGGFGMPPYGLPIDVYMTLWTGRPVPQRESEQQAAPQDTHATPAQQGTMTVTTMKTSPPPATAPAETPESKYVTAVMTKISPSVKLPAKLADGKYNVSVVVRVDGMGQITQAKLTKSSAHADLDNAIMRAVTRAGKVGTPPGKDTQDLNLTFVIQKP